MLAATLRLAAISPGRQQALRRAVVGHVALLLACAGWLRVHTENAPTILAFVLLTAGIVEGAVLLGWRLTQLPKSQALAFLLVTPQPVGGVLYSEVVAGLCRLALVTAAGLPILVGFVLAGVIEPLAVAP